jgi:hypothetical protein
MKNLLLLVLFLAFSQHISGQQNYNDFEGGKVSYFGYHTGMLDSMFVNPAINVVDSSANCARYIRDTTLYDNLQIHPNNKLVDVSSYSTGWGALKMKMKLYTSAPVGTQVLLQLGSSSIPSYPAGIHSEYMAVTTAQNAWQHITFNFSQMTPGGTVSSTNIDKIVLLFSPSTMSADTFYIDDLTGPAIAAVGVPSAENLPAFRLFQNNPNPAKELTNIVFQLNTPGEVSLKIYDMLGNPIVSLLEQNLKPGSYNIPVETANIPNGVYFYVLKKEGLSRSLKMIVSK